MILRFAHFACPFILIIAVVCAQKDKLNELPDCSESNVPQLPRKIVLVSTLDGQVTALNGDTGGMVMWSVGTGPDPLLSSSIHKLELTNHGHWVRMIPSLSGGLYKFNGINIETLPVRADHLLQSSSFLLNDGLVISGGRESRIYSIAVDNGEVLYECSMKGCENHNNTSSNMIVIQRHTQTVRAIDIHTGSERWNFSVGQHDVKLASDFADCHVREPEQIIPDFHLKASIPEGLVYAIRKSRPNSVLWKHKFLSPVVAIWKMENGRLDAVDLFHENLWFMNTDSTNEIAPALYLGMHQKQLYIQESIPMQNSVRRTASYISQNEPTKIMQIPWQPIQATSTALGIVSSSNTDDSSHDDAPITALSVLYASEYVNGNGYYLFNKNVDAKSDEKCNAGEEANVTSDAKDNEFGEERVTSVNVVIVSLWYWWKEVLIIFTTAFLVNLIVTQRILNMVQMGSKDTIQKEIVIVEKPVPAEIKIASHQIVADNSSETSQLKSFELPSRYLEDFETVRCLGKGGFGVVFEARNKIDECMYAVKRIALPNSLESRDRVLREVKALATLEHQHIVRYYNAWMECPTVGWIKDHDSMYCKLYQTDDAESDEDSMPSTNYSDNIPEGSVPFSSERKRLKGSLMNSTYSENSQNENDSYIVFEGTNKELTSIDLCEESEHVSVVVEATEAGLDSSSDIMKQSAPSSSYLKRKEKRKKCSDSDFSVLDIPQNAKPARMYLYIQMQLCHKESLREWLSENVVKRDKKRLLQMFGQIIQAVEYIHLKGLIHRDLKPSNIYFDKNNHIRVGDFGLVTAMTRNIAEDYNERQRTADNEKHTAEVGTRIYMSPEQMQGQSYDHKVDIYSLGIIFFELLYPFTTYMERHNTLLALRRNEFPSDFRNQFTKEYGLLRLMLSPCPEKRPTTMEIRAQSPLAEMLD